jgi:hypothetical protein
VSAPQQYTAGGPQAATDERIYQVIVAVNNPTSQALSTSDVAITATVNGNAVEAVPLDEPIVQNIEPNMQLNVPFRFRVKNGTTGPLQVTVQNGTGKPVYFTSTIQ